MSSFLHSSSALAITSGLEHFTPCHTTWLAPIIVSQSFLRYSRAMEESTPPLIPRAISFFMVIVYNFSN